MCNKHLKLSYWPSPHTCSSVVSLPLEMLTPSFYLFKPWISELSLAPPPHIPHQIHQHLLPILLHIYPKIITPHFFNTESLSKLPSLLPHIIAFTSLFFSLLYPDHSKHSSGGNCLQIKLYDAPFKSLPLSGFAFDACTFWTGLQGLLWSSPMSYLRTLSPPLLSTYSVPVTWPLAIGQTCHMCSNSSA